MTCSKELVSRMLIVSIAVLSLWAAPLISQDKISPISDYQNKKDYAQVEVIGKEPDMQKRADAYVAFMKEHPISKMLLYVTQSYLAAQKPNMDKKDWPKLISAQETFLGLMPTEQSVKAQNLPAGADEYIKEQVVPAHKLVLQGVMGAYYQSNNLPKAAEVGEKLYAIDSDKAMAATLADIYLKSQNVDKFAVYAEKTVENFPIEQSYVMALQLAQVYLQKQNMPKAKELYTKVLGAFGEKAPQGVQEPAWNATKAVAYSVLGADAYSQKDYPKALELYGKVTTLDPKNDAAYYYIGMAKWQSKDQVGAIEAFAKTVVLEKANAAKAKGYLENLYKAQHNDSLDGLDQVLAKAKTELGI